MSCVDCGTTKRPHKARGFCHPCYENWRRKTSMRLSDCPVCNLPKRTGSAKCDACKAYFHKHGVDRPRHLWAPVEIKSSGEPVIIKANLAKGRSVKVPKWDLYGTIVNAPYLFYGQQVCDLKNQHGEIIQGIPKHLIEIEEGRG